MHSTSQHMTARNTQDARKVLNKARKQIPAERAIWIAAAKLEEAAGNVAYVPHLTSPHLTSPHLTSPHLTSTDLASAQGERKSVG